MKLDPRPGTGMSPYHHGKPSARTRLEDRPFIAWDGEGVNLKGPGRPQSYVLFGSSVGHISNQEGLSAFDCLDHILETGAANPGAVHCGFAFSYDANMIIHSLSPTSLSRLHKNGWVRLKRADGRRYTLTFAKGKFFRVTLYRPEYHAKQNPHAKTTVQIFDIWSFFGTSFIKAYEQMIGSVPDVIREGKAGRAEFKIEEYAEILTYWSLESQMLKDLAVKRRKRVYNAGLRISQWHGPGALATYALRQHKIKEHMAVSSDAVKLAARHAYAGGRFECYKIGLLAGPVYGYDINSAYPHAIRQLPSFSDGEWRHVTNPGRITKFGVYHVRMKRGRGFDATPSPLFHQLEWAGWITSLTRARLFDVMRRIPFDQLIAVETDGVYTTIPPNELGIQSSDELGDWEIKQYEEVMYVQSGLAWRRSSESNWTDKRRGLDPCRRNHQPETCDCSNVFSLSACREYLSGLHPRPARGSEWSTYKGESTRFLGLGQALMSASPTHSKHCVWETAPREITPGGGKRIHVPSHCAACAADATAYELGHDLVINSRAVVEPYSYPHSIPWEDEVGHADWRDYEDDQDGIVTLS